MLTSIKHQERLRKSENQGKGHDEVPWDCPEIKQRSKIQETAIIASLCPASNGIDDIQRKGRNLQASERTVQRLIGELEQMRAKPGQPMSLNIEDVIQLVYSINLARGVDAEGPESYIATQYASSCPCVLYRIPIIKTLNRQPLTPTL